MKVKFLSIFFLLIVGASAVIAQTTAFTYQGKLSAGVSSSPSYRRVGFFPGLPAPGHRPHIRVTHFL